MKEYPSEGKGVVSLPIVIKDEPVSASIILITLFPPGIVPPIEGEKAHKRSNVNVARETIRFGNSSNPHILKVLLKNNSYGEIFYTAIVRMHACTF